MARGVNKVILVGNLGADPEVRRSEQGVAFGSLRVATTEQWKSRENNENVERTEWHRVRVFRGLAEVAERYLKKGDRIYVEGRMETRSYEKDGITRYATDVVAREMIMLGKRSSDSDGDYTPQQSSSAPAGRASSPAKESPADDSAFEDDLPF